jgi:radical SAM superfamily enzyme YgiQ (UPF0313 family)
MRVALVYPFTKRCDHSCNPPLALLYLATTLRDSDVEVSIFDLDAFTGGLQEQLKAIVDYQPDVVGMPVYTIASEFKSVQIICRGVRERLPAATILAGGPHPTALPTETLEWFPEMDFVLQGEADYTLRDLVEQLSHNVSRPSVPGLYYRENGTIKGIMRCKPPQDLDAIPIPTENSCGRIFGTACTGVSTARVRWTS